MSFLPIDAVATFRREANKSPDIPPKIRELQDLWDRCNPNEKNPFRTLSPPILKPLVLIGPHFWNGLEGPGLLQVFQKIKTIPFSSLASATNLHGLWDRIPNVEYRIALFDRVRANPAYDHWAKLLPSINSIPKEDPISPEFFSMIEEKQSPHWGSTYRYAKCLLEEFSGIEATPKLAKLILEDRENKDWKFTASQALYILRNDISNIDTLIEIAQSIKDNSNEEETNIWENTILIMCSIWDKQINLYILLALIEFYVEYTNYDWKMAISITQEILADLPLSSIKVNISFINDIIISKDSKALGMAKNIWNGAIIKDSYDRWYLLEILLGNGEDDEELDLFIDLTRPIWDKFSLLTDRIYIFEFALKKFFYPWETLTPKALPLLPIIKNPVDWFKAFIGPAIEHNAYNWERTFTFLPSIIQEEDFATDKTTSSIYWKKDLLIFKEIAKNSTLDWEKRFTFAEKFWKGIPDPSYRESPQGTITRYDIVLHTPLPVPTEWENALHLVEYVHKNCTSILNDRWTCFNTALLHPSLEEIALLSENIWIEMKSLLDRFKFLLFIKETPDETWSESIRIGTLIWEGCRNQNDLRGRIANIIRTTICAQNWELAIQQAKKNLRWNATNSAEDRMQLVFFYLEKLPLLF
jgi:hypothetical protein